MARTRAVLALALAASLAPSCDAFAMAARPLARPMARAQTTHARSLKTMIMPVDPLRKQAVLRDNRYRSDDWLANLLTIPQSRVLRRIAFHLVTNVLWAVAVLALSLKKGIALTLPPLPHTILGGFLSLLLVFRTNSAYGRFWEARIIWGGIMNTCRNLAQYGVTHVRRISPELAERYMQLLACFPHALAHRCVSGRIPLEDRVKKALPEPQWANIPSNVLLELREVVRQAAEKHGQGSLQDTLDTRLQLKEVTNRVDDLVDGLGKCERILRSPIPLSYSRHTSRFLSVWCAGLPLILLGPLGNWMPAAVAVICWALFSIEEIGHLIEMPFVPSLYPISDATGVNPERLESEKQRKQPHPYSYGVPVEVMASVICQEVEDIGSTNYGK